MTDTAVKLATEPGCDAELLRLVRNDHLVASVYKHCLAFRLSDSHRLKMLTCVLANDRQRMHDEMVRTKNEQIIFAMQP